MPFPLWIHILLLFRRREIRIDREEMVGLEYKILFKNQIFVYREIGREECAHILTFGLEENLWPKKKKSS